MALSDSRKDGKAKEILILFHSGFGSTRIVSEVLFREKVEGDTMKGHWETPEGDQGDIELIKQ